jgi:hypothetical protein
MVKKTGGLSLGRARNKHLQKMSNATSFSAVSMPSYDPPRFTYSNIMQCPVSVSLLIMHRGHDRTGIMIMHSDHDRTKIMIRQRDLDDALGS